MDLGLQEPRVSHGQASQGSLAVCPSGRHQVCQPIVCQRRGPSGRVRYVSSEDGLATCHHEHGATTPAGRVPLFEILFMAETMLLLHVSS